MNVHVGEELLPSAMGPMWLLHAGKEWRVAAGRLSSAESPSIQKTSYRCDIDGLRAIAVGLVVLGHTGLLFSGGFVGVDVFFVISGFLITRLIVAGYDAGTFTLKQFWLRRMRRILPAAAVAVGATLLVGMIMLQPTELAALGESAIAQQAFVANVYFWAQGGYFDLPSEYKPLLHTWSLAVEEQFYLIWPLILILVCRWGKKGIVLTIGTIALFSIIVSAMMTRTHPSAAFYFMPPRMWELLLGAGVLFCPGIRRSPLVGLTGLALIVTSAVAYTRTTPMLGLFALAPCLGTALIILAPATSRLSLTALLSTAPVVYVGKASYSIYLWHWPLLVFSKIFLVKDFSLGAKAALVVASVAIGSLSYEFVETPIRSRRWLQDGKQLVFSCGLVAIIICATACSMVSYLNARYSEVAMTITMPLVAKSKSVIGIDPKRADCSILGGTGPRSFVLWGDSHAVAIASLCDELARSRGLCGQCFAAPSIHPLLGVWSNDPFQRREIQLEWNRRVVEWIKKNNVPNVIVVSRWERPVPSRLIDWRANINDTNDESRQNLICKRLDQLIQDDHSPGASDEDARRVWQEHFRETISALGSAGTRVWFLMQVPVQVDDPRGKATRGVSANVYEAQQYEIHRVLKSWSSPWLSVMGPGTSWFDTDGYSFMGDSGGSYYIDKDHVSSYGAKKLLRPLLEPVFDRMKQDLRGGMQL
jgi:peptidoglycan/LPS O-acetylase OafA/YrhL